MESENKYIIKGGEAGKKRLDVIAEILNESTKKIIESEGSIEGKKFLDLGCGGGNLAIMAAEMVGNTGNVTAIDFDDEIIALARKDAAAQNIQNISFNLLNAYSLDYDHVFDIVYSRFLLSHLQEPMTVLSNMLKGLKSGGRILIEDIDFSGHFCFPECKAFDLYLNYFTTAAKNNGQNPNIGLSLYEMFSIAQVEKIQFDVIQPYYYEGSGKWMAYYTMDKIKETVIEQSLASSQGIQQVLNELEDFTNDKSSIISLPRIFRVWGIKK